MIKYLLAAASIAGAVVMSAPASADTYDPSVLSDSQLALVMGATGQPDPNAAYLTDVGHYLDPLGFHGTEQALDTSETFNFGPSVTATEGILTSTVNTDYLAGDFSAADPLTLFCYSQSCVSLSADEQNLYNTLTADGDPNPSGSIDIVGIGDTSAAHTISEAGTTSGGFLDNLDAFYVNLLDDLGWGNIVNVLTPDNLFQSYFYTESGDYYADNVNAASQEIYHYTYAGLTPAEIASGMTPDTTVVEGMSTYFDIPQLDFTSLLTDLMTGAPAIGL